LRVWSDKTREAMKRSSSYASEGKLWNVHPGEQIRPV